MDRAFSGTQPAESPIHRVAKARDALVRLAIPPMTEGLTAAGGHGGQWRGGASERAQP